MADDLKTALELVSVLEERHELRDADDEARDQEIQRWKEKCWALEADMACRNELRGTIVRLEAERDTARRELGEAREALREACAKLDRIAAENDLRVLAEEAAEYRKRGGIAGTEGSGT